MFRRMIVIGGAIAAVLVIVVGGLYYLGGRGGGERGFLARLQSGLQTITQLGSKAPSSEAGGEFVFTRLDIDTTKPQAEACLTFSRNLDISGRTHYQVYLSIDP